MTRSELLDLAARVEAAQGADRLLDAQTAEALGWTRDEDTETGEVVWVWPDGKAWGHLPAYTASRDAAASLEPADWHVTVRGLNDSWHVEMNTTWAPTAERPARTVTAFCGNEARARTAAALRARAEEADE